MLQSEYSVMSESQVTKRQKTNDGSSRPGRSNTWFDIVSGRISDGIVYNLKYMYIRSNQWQMLMEHIRRVKHWRKYRNVIVQLMYCRNPDESFFYERLQEDEWG